MTIEQLEPAAEWRAADIVDDAAWTLRLTDDDHAELDAALRTALAHSSDPLELRREHFPLDGMQNRLQSFADELINGRGFGRISALDTHRYTSDELSLQIGRAHV